MEQWIDIPEYEGRYQASNTGHIRSIRNFHQNRVLKPGLSTSGYLVVALLSKSHLVHRLIAMCFCDNPERKEFVNHKDGNKLNNNASNLEWCTRQENVDHGYANGLMRKARGINHYKARLTDSDIPKIRELSKSGLSNPEIAKQFSMPTASIRNIVLGKHWTHI